MSKLKTIITSKWVVLGTICAIAVGLFYWFFPSTGGSSDVPVFPVKRGDLQITVLQGGEIRALKNYEVRSEIEYPTKIMSLIPEGTLITEDDIKEGKVLVELDGSDLKDKITTHEIEFQTTVAAYIEADENREIVRSENQSLVADANTASLFALMDFEKYLGKKVAASILKDRTLPETVAAFETYSSALESASKSPSLTKDAIEKDAEPAAKPAASAPAVAKAPSKAAATPKKITLPVRPDYAKYLDADDSSDGEAQQKLGQLKGDLLLHQGELSLAKQTLEASAKLASKEFITKSALENDQVSFDKVELSVKTAEVALELFRRYEFPKQCEQFLSSYQDSLHKLQRTTRQNRSRMAQAESKFQTAKRRYDMELAKKEDLERQLKACVIKAQQPGLVAYGPINASASTRYSEPIEEGAAVRLRQVIITIPDMNEMGVHVSIHESQVKKVRIGQHVRVRVDAEPGKELYGQVAELAVLPDSTSSRYTPNLKVYPCSVHIEGTQEWLKPGMNAKVEIVISDLANVIYVPVQSIEVENDEARKEDHHYCYVSQGGELKRREVDIGGFNDEFIEIRNGLNEGENVSLTVPKKSLIDMSDDDASPSDHAAAKPADSKAADAKGKAKSADKEKAGVAAR